jgi:hypothetical protein
MPGTMRSKASKGLLNRQGRPSWVAVRGLLVRCGLGVRCGDGFSFSAVERSDALSSRSGQHSILQHRASFLSVRPSCLRNLPMAERKGWTAVRASRRSQRGWRVASGSSTARRNSRSASSRWETAGWFICRFATVFFYSLYQQASGAVPTGSGESAQAQGTQGLL